VLTILAAEITKERRHWIKRRIQCVHVRVRQRRNISSPKKRIFPKLKILKCVVGPQKISPFRKAPKSAFCTRPPCSTSGRLDRDLTCFYSVPAQVGNVSVSRLQSGLIVEVCSFILRLHIRLLSGVERGRFAGCLQTGGTRKKSWLTCYWARLRRTRKLMGNGDLPPLVGRVKPTVYSPVFDVACY
jgi:hypothetical protein